MDQTAVRWGSSRRIVAGGLGLLATLVATVPARALQTADPLSFVVLGHIRADRGEPTYSRLDELLSKVEALDPDLVFLTGDMIWGEVAEPLADSAEIRAEWETLDAALGRLGAPIHRVPGNHDIHDPVTRDIYFERYGDYPRVVTSGNTRFILLNTTFVPEGDGPVPVKQGKTVRLDSAQVAFVREELARGGYDHTFVLGHHVLWWRADAPWWEDVHPHLVASGVRAVFSGDLGPVLFTHLEADGIQYLRSIVDATADRPVSGETTVARAVRALPTLQLETFVHVTVDGPAPGDVRYSVETVGALSSGAFSPARWREIFGEDPDESRYYDPADLADPDTSASEPGLVERVWQVVGSPRRLGALGAAVALAFAGGWLFGAARVRRGHAT